ncbi:MAG: ABC transporter substrate-binding protein [Nitrosopumilus sp. D6]|nr:MAG: ABC transporter substrate-binding protein [Nitrosopumilus sp. D6]
MKLGEIKPRVMKPRVMIGIGGAIAAAVIIFALLGPSDPPPVRPVEVGLEGEIKIGLLAATSGDFDAYGQENVAAAMLAESTFNKYLEEAGENWSIKIVAKDTQSDPETALEKIEELDMEGIKLVSGPETSASITNIMEYTAENDMLLFSCCSTAPSLAIPGDNVFRLITDDTKQGLVFSKLLEHEGIEAIVPVWRGDVWGDGLIGATADNYDGVINYGIRYYTYADRFTSHTDDLVGRVQNLIDEHGAEKVAILYLGFGEMVRFIEAASVYEILDDVRWFGSDSNTNDEALAMEPTVEFTEKTKLTTVQVSASGESAFYAVRDHVKEEIGREPSAFAHAAYDTIWLIGLAMQEVQSAETSLVAAALPTVALSYEGAIGATRLNGAGDLAESDYSIWGIRDGQWERLGIFDYSDGAILFDELGLGEVQIGLLIPETGTLEYFGEEVLLATQIGVAEFNEYLEGSGQTWRMTLEARDTKSNVQDALAELENLDKNGIEIILGATSSATITGIKDYSDDNDMLILGCCSSAPSLAIPDDSVFRMVPDDRQHAVALARLLEHEKIEAVIPVWRGDVWGDGLSAAGQKEFAGVMDEGIRYDVNTDEFSEQAKDLAGRMQGYADEYGIENVAVWYMGFSEMIQFVQDASVHEILGDVRWFGSGPNTKEISLVNDSVGGDFLSDTKFTMVHTAPSDGPAAYKLYKHVEEDLGRAPNSYAHAAYDAVWIAGLAISKLQDTDALKIREILPDVASRYSGALGSITFNEAGDLAESDYEIWGIRDGEWKRLGIYSYSDGSITLG